ncbi:MAG: tripartite tricarboxylate transporter permease [Burkholderiales bacterium]|nr:tripartite tricarboxylate transporter permease [Burkholderiales bacterium]
MGMIQPAEWFSALAILADPLLWLWIVGGVAIGVIFGATPGLTATAGVAIATPLTFGLDFRASMALLLGIYCGGYFSGSIPAILMNIPGAPGNAATAIDGHAMARRGEADRAICLAVSASFAGAMFSLVVLALAAPALAGFALQFTAVEYAMLGVFGMTCVAGISGGALGKGVVGAVLGMTLGTVGIDSVGGMERLTLDMPGLQGGVPLVPALLAFFALSELMGQAGESQRGDVLPSQNRARLGEALAQLLRRKWLLLKSSMIGTAVGVLPGTGPTIAAWLSYGDAVRSGARKRRFGEGAEEGVIAPEAANNAVTGGALVPLLTLGIPGDTVTAVLIGALLIHGIDPGPFFMTAQANLFAQILMILVFANVAMLAIGLGLRRWLPKILGVPLRILIPLVAVICAAGGFAINNSPFDVGLIAALGLGGYVLLAFGVPMPPIVIGLVLGPIIERNLRDALTVHHMDPMIFVTRPISAALLVVTVATVAVAVYRGRTAARSS